MARKTRRALIDGDEVAYKASVLSPSATEIDWGDIKSSKETTAADHIRIANNLIRRWLDRTASDDATICFSPDDRSELFRRDIFLEYKNGRTPKPDHFWEVVAALKRDYEWEALPGLEADDVMGILSADTEDEERVVISSDKDLKTVPCRLYDPYHDTKRVIPKVEADRFWMFQTLTGDRTDGFSGCPGVGKVGATKLLEGHTTIASMWPAVVQMYKDKGSDEAEAFKQASLARILRPGDYDHEHGIIRWKVGRNVRLLKIKENSP